MVMARAVVAALAACAAAFEHEQRVCPNDKPTNVSDTIFKERVVVFDEAMGARVVVAGDINKDGRNDLVSLDSYAFPTHEKSVTLSAATTRSKMAAMKLQASEGDGDEDALSPV